VFATDGQQAMASIVIKFPRNAIRITQGFSCTNSWKPVLRVPTTTNRVGSSNWPDRMPYTFLIKPRRSSVIELG
jgi:hypothetical protein